MKVGKEEIVGALAALEEWLLGDKDGRNEQQLASWLQILSTISERLAAVPIDVRVLPARSRPAFIVVG
ncbi:hypothetical protein [Sinorhizobium meliloti]|uniref:hypothetical protein n=1 Tax=Rhizobium meliloti TaxID=382 RepID=UPI0012950B5D|nr:hypothetical protein [Sinorhizobium meliloti]MQW44733.1 hypothetical protein [Sinorhizobium meliloti]